jgi:hypothetical protein
VFDHSEQAPKVRMKEAMMMMMMLLYLHHDSLLNYHHMSPNPNLPEQ